MKRVLSLVVALAMILALCGCDLLRSQRPQAQPSEELPTQTPYEPDDGKSMLVPRPDSSQLPFEFTLTQDQVDEFYDLLEQCEQICMENPDPDTADEIYTQVEDAMALLEDQGGIAQVIYYSDMSNQEAKDRFLDCTDMLADASDAYIEMMRRIYNSDSTAKAVLFEDWTEQDLLMLERYTSEVADLEKRNAEILVAYKDLEDMSSDAMIPLYLEQVENNNRIARIYGYANYYEYAFEMVYDRDYAPDQLEAMRQYVAQYIADDFDAAYDIFLDGVDDLNFMDSMRLNGFLTMDYDQMDQDYVGMYLQRLPDSMREGMMSAFEPGNSYFTSNPEAHEGAFTTVIGGKSFCYYGPGYASSTTVIHEVGHYYGSQYADLDAMSYDLAETQSQGNEWLFTGMLEDFVSKELYGSFLSYKFYNDMGTILICVLVDEFEQQIYSHQDPGSLTPADCNQIMEDICAKYGGTEYIATYITDIQSYWRMVVLENPVYYISYAVSATAAMNLYTLYQQDPNAAIEAYRVLTEQDWEGEGFLEALEVAGLPSPFEESVYVELDKIFD